MDSVCPKCNDTGWITSENDGKSYARRCDCRSESLLLNRGEKANIPQKFLGSELSGYLTESRKDSLNRSKSKAEKFVRDYPAVAKGLIFTGPVGVGKTRLLCSVATELLQKFEEIDLFYIDWNDLVHTMRSGQDSGARDFEKINRVISRMCKAELLLFDELGASRVSPWVHDNIYYIINYRYNHQKVTLGGTNFSDRPAVNSETLAMRLGDRMRSRLYEMCDICELSSGDFRRENG